MTIKITAAIRSTVRAIVAGSNDYDAETVIIHRDGTVSALKDADKTLAGNSPTRFVIGHVSTMVTAAGERREGY